MNISNNDLATILEQHATGTIFSAKFIKRTDGTVRTMLCRKGVQKGVTGKGLAFDPEAKRLLSVFEMPKEQFRFINLLDLVEAHVGGVHYQVV